MEKETKIINLLEQLSPQTFIDLCKKRVIPFHCELGTSMVEFIDHINGDEGELIIDAFVSQGLDSRYNVLNYPILENAMRNVDLTKMSDLRDLYEYCYSTIQNHNNQLQGQNHSSLISTLDADGIDPLDPIGMGEIQAGMNAVINNGPRTFNGRPIRGLYIVDDDEFLKLHPELEPFESQKAITIGDWWKGLIDGGDRESTNELITDTIGTISAGYEFQITYLGNGRFHFTDTVNNEGLMYPVDLGHIDDWENISYDNIEYQTHFKLV